MFRQKSMEKVREKLSTMSLSMWNRKISPSGLEFNQGLGKSRPWSRMRLRVSFICIVVGQGNPTRGPE